MTKAGAAPWVSSASPPCEISVDPRYTVQVTATNEPGIVAELVSPRECVNSTQKVVIVLGGSEGGIPTYIARALAERGLSVLALGYFGLPGEVLPDSLNRISLEYFEKALGLARRLVPRSECCVVMGFSKGAEGALAFASIARPELRGLVLVSGTHAAFEGFDSTGSGRSAGNSAWVYQGNDVAFTPYVVPDPSLLAMMFPKGFGYPPVLKPFYEASLALATGSQGSLPIENVRGPILFLSGQDDQMWPSSSMSRLAIERAKRNGFPHEIQHHSFSSVGHFVFFGERMLQADSFDPTRFGGTVEGSRMAEPLAWGELALFLRKVFHP
jgi:dienelactone hydrolase